MFRGRQGFAWFRADLPLDPKGGAGSLHFETVDDNAAVSGTGLGVHSHAVLITERLKDVLALNNLAENRFLAVQSRIRPVEHPELAAVNLSFSFRQEGGNDHPLVVAGARVLQRERVPGAAEAGACLITGHPAGGIAGHGPQLLIDVEEDVAVKEAVAGQEGETVGGFGRVREQLDLDVALVCAHGGDIRLALVDCERRPVGPGERTACGFGSHICVRDGRFVAVAPAELITQCDTRHAGDHDDDEE